MLKVIKKLVRKGAHLTGYDLVRLDQIPRHTYMGLRIRL
jgi:hypothetical protein